MLSNCRLIPVVVCFFLFSLSLLCFAEWTEYGPIYQINFGIDFVNSNLGWTCGAKNAVGPVIDFSSDGGRNWINQTSELSSWWWYDIDFINQNVGYACGLAALLFIDSVYKTTNGGETWETAYNQSASTMLTDVQVLDEKTVIACGMWTRWFKIKYGVLITDNGGTSWKECGWGTDAWASFTWFLDRRHGWVSGGKWPVEEPTPLTSNGYFPYPLFPLTDGERADYRAVVCRTSDGGSSFTKVFDVPGFAVNHIHFINRNEGWFAGYGDDGHSFKGYIFHTTDGGDTWEEQYDPAGDYATVSDIHMFNRREGWAIGFKSGLLTVNAVIRHTADGGETWEIDPWNTNTGPVNMVWLNESEGWFTGGNDFQYSRIAHYYDPDRAPKAELNNISPPQTAHPGETVEWRISGKNLTEQSLTGDIWLSVTSPNIPPSSSPYLVEQYSDITIPPGSQGQAPVSFQLPTPTPEGIYNIEVLFGPYGSGNPYDIIGYDSFDIEIDQPE